MSGRARAATEGGGSARERRRDRARDSKSVAAEGSRVGRGVRRTAHTFISHPRRSSPSVKLAYPRVASSASSSCAICSRDFWFFQSPPPPPPRRCAWPLPRPASPYMLPLDRPEVLPLKAG